MSPEKVKSVLRRLHPKRKARQVGAGKSPQAAAPAHGGVGTVRNCPRSARVNSWGENKSGVGTGDEHSSELFQVRTNGGFMPYDVSADGQHFLVASGVEERRAQTVTVILAIGRRCNSITRCSSKGTASGLFKR